MPHHRKIIYGMISFQNIPFDFNVKKPLITLLLIFIVIKQNLL